MNRNSGSCGAMWSSRRAVGRVAALACAAMVQASLFAGGVTRSVEPVAGGCKVTLSWDLSGNVESALVIEERFASGWTVDGSTVPFGSLDASWLSGGVARFAVKPSLLAEAGSISFTVVSGEGAAAGTVAGDWKMYLAGSLQKGTVAGSGALAALSANEGTAGTLGAVGTAGAAGNVSVVEKAVAITSFKMLGGGVVELSYSGIEKAGTLVLEGCEGLGKPWTEVRRDAVPAGSGNVQMEPAEAAGLRFFRLKLLTEE